MILLVFSTSINAQKFVKYIDEFTDKEYVLVDKNEITYNGDSKSEGVVWGLMTTKSGDFWVANTLSLSVYGLSCVEDTEVIIIFENGEKLTKQQWNKFNCDGNVWITLKDSDIALFRSQRIDKIKVTNKRNYESYTFTDLNESMKNYFIRLLTSLDDGNKNGFEVKKDEN